LRMQRLFKPILADSLLRRCRIFGYLPDDDAA